MIRKYLSENIRTSIENINLENAGEIRIRCNKPIYIIYSDNEVKIDYRPDEKDIMETFSRLCQYSPFAYIEDIRRGYITIEKGCRIGICGTVVEGNNLKDITSLNIRIAHQFLGCGNIIADNTKGNVLIASPPAYGKTTMLRDIIRQLSNKGKNIGVADERGEISGAGFDLGERTDVIVNCNKSKGMEMLLRSMAPDIIAVDELGGKEDIASAFGIIHSGVNLIATIHCRNMEEIIYRLGELYKVFDYVAILGGIGRVEKIYNRERIIWQQSLQVEY